MEQGVFFDTLELRRARNGTRTLSGSFPYGKRAIMSAGGNGRRPRKEVFKSRAFSFAVDDPDRNIHLLSGHSFDRPLASKFNRTLELEDTDDALNFEATLTPEIQTTSWGADFLNAFAAGLIVGISPGFRVPPSEAVPNAEETIEENPAEGNALIRVIAAAVLFELSVVTRPAYDETELQMRSKLAETQRVVIPAHFNRWR